MNFFQKGGIPNFLNLWENIGYSIRAVVYGVCSWIALWSVPIFLNWWTNNRVETCSEILVVKYRNIVVLRRQEVILLAIVYAQNPVLYLTIIYSSLHEEDSATEVNSTGGGFSTMTYKPLRLHCALQTSEVTLHSDLQIAVMESTVQCCKVNTPIFTKNKPLFSWPWVRNEQRPQ